MLITRFLTKCEYIRTLGLFIKCFGDDKAYVKDLYGELDGENECTGFIRNHRICVVENEKGEILSMVQIRPVKAVYLDSAKIPDDPHHSQKFLTLRASIRPENDGTMLTAPGMPTGSVSSKADSKETMINVSYILCVATRSDVRRKGLMDRLMHLTFTKLVLKKEPWCFLVPVDKEIYRHLGFEYDWYFKKGEEKLLDADNGLNMCSAKLLTASSFCAPDFLRS